MAAAGRRAQGGHRRSLSAVYFLGGDVQMIVFRTKTCIPWQAYEIVTQPAIANNLCAF